MAVTKRTIPDHIGDMRVMLDRMEQAYKDRLWTEVIELARKLELGGMYFVNEAQWTKKHGQFREGREQLALEREQAKVAGAIH